MLASRELCSGCGACAAACPHNCIKLVQDSEGFAYPLLDSSRCVACGRCRGACPVQTPPVCNPMPEALAAKHTDPALREKSSSGGVFSALAEAVLAAGGAVCAAGYEEDLSVKHRVCFAPSQLEGLRGAKYVQSRADHCFAQLKALLEKNVPVLFVGTPCQCAGFRGYLGKDPETLLTVDMICHGVPSPMVWQRYLQEQGAVQVNMRSKQSGWSRYGYSMQLRLADGSCRLTPQGKEPYLRGFVENLFLRPSCAACSFKGLQRSSDLTLGDFWGIWDLAPEFDDDRGTSLLLLHTEKGKKAWKQVEEQFAVLPFPGPVAVAQNPSAETASRHHPMRKEFFEGLASGTVEDCITRCLEPPKPRRSLLRRVLGRLKR